MGCVTSSGQFFTGTIHQVLVLDAAAAQTGVTSLDAYFAARI
jgi:hypothetical protein